MPSLRSAVSRVLVAWSTGGVGSAHLTAVSAVTHGRVRRRDVNKRCASQRSTIWRGGHNVSYQLPREPPIVPYLVHTCSTQSVKLEPSAVGVARWCAGLSIRTESDECVSSIQPPWSLHAAVEQRSATSTVTSASDCGARMESLERSIRQMHSPPSIGGSTRSHRPQTLVRSTSKKRTCLSLEIRRPHEPSLAGSRRLTINAVRYERKEDGTIYK